MGISPVLDHRQLLQQHNEGRGNLSFLFVCQINDPLEHLRGETFQVLWDERRFRLEGELPFRHFQELFFQVRVKILDQIGNLGQCLVFLGTHLPACSDFV